MRSRLMRSRLITYTVTVLVAALGAAVVFAIGTRLDRPATGDAAPPSGTQWMDEGDPAPDFELSTLDGDTFRLAEYTGRVVVLNFWATWCAPCRVEIPDLIDMQTEFGEDVVRFVGISVDHQGKDVVSSFVDEMGVNYPVVIDDGSVSDKYGGIYALPMTFVIDHEGTIRWRKAGLVRRDALEPAIGDLTAALMQSP